MRAGSGRDIPDTEGRSSKLSVPSICASMKPARTTANAGLAHAGCRAARGEAIETIAVPVPRATRDEQGLAVRRPAGPRTEISSPCTGIRRFWAIPLPSTTWAGPLHEEDWPRFAVGGGAHRASAAR